MPFQRGHHHSKGRPPAEKSFANMLRIAIKESHDEGGDKLRAVADTLVRKAIEGDVSAIREIADRLDGKVPAAVEMSGGLSLSHEEVLEQLA